MLYNPKSTAWIIIMIFFFGTKIPVRHPKTYTMLSSFFFSGGGCIGFGHILSIKCIPRRRFICIAHFIQKGNTMCLPDEAEIWSWQLSDNGDTNVDNSGCLKQKSVYHKETNKSSTQRVFNKNQKRRLEPKRKRKTETNQMRHTMTHNHDKKTTKHRQRESCTMNTRGQGNTGVKYQNQEWHWDTGENNETTRKAGKQEWSKRENTRWDETTKIKQEILKETMTVGGQCLSHFPISDLSSLWSLKTEKVF